LEKKVSEIAWRLLELSIFHLYWRYQAIVRNAISDETGLLFQFSIQLGSSDSPKIITLTLARFGNGILALLLVS
jgi:hypothetical protein